MSGIPRYRMTNNFGQRDNDNGTWVRHEDHMAAVLMGGYLEGYVQALTNVLDDIEVEKCETVADVRRMIRHMIDDTDSE